MLRVSMMPRISTSDRRERTRDARHRVSTSDRRERTRDARHRVSTKIGGKQANVNSPIKNLGSGKIEMRPYRMNSPKCLPLFSLFEEDSMETG